MRQPKDTRFHARLQTYVQCEAILPKASCKAELANLAVGGLAFRTEKSVAAVGEPVTIRVTLPDDMVFELDGTVVREHKADGKLTYGVRLATSDVDQRDASLELLECLLDRHGPGDRGSPRVERRYPVVAVAGEEFNAEMVNVSKRGIGIEGVLPLKTNDPIEVKIALRLFSATLSLTGEVVYVRRLSDTRSRAGIRFVGLSENQNLLLEDFLQLLLRGG